MVSNARLKLFYQANVHLDTSALPYRELWSRVLCPIFLLYTTYAPETMPSLASLWRARTGAGDFLTPLAYFLSVVVMVYLAFNINAPSTPFCITPAILL